MGVPRILGADWAGRYPGRYPDRRPVTRQVGVGCPVCGHPTGDCTHDQEARMANTPAGGKPAKKAAATPPARDTATGAPPAPAGKPSTLTTSPPPPTDAAPGTIDPTQVVPVSPDGTIGADYEPMGDTGAANAHEELAGGMHEASVALDEEYGTVDEPDLRRRAFTDLGNGSVQSTRDVSVEFVPANAIRSSRILAFPKGQVFSRAAVARKIAMYDDRPDAKIVYGSTG